MDKDKFSKANPPDSTIAQPPIGIKPLTREESRAELTRAIHDAEGLLFRESTMFPFTPFPHTLTVDRTKITITKRFFFLMAETQSFRIEDILSASCSVGPFFGSVMIISRIMNKEQEIRIGPFWRSDAERAKRIIHGYIIAKQRAIDTSQLKTKELCDMLYQLGEDNHH